jgi:hypothetical protein
VFADGLGDRDRERGLAVDARERGDRIPVDLDLRDGSDRGAGRRRADQRDRLHLLDAGELRRSAP